MSLSKQIQNFATIEFNNDHSKRQTDQFYSYMLRRFLKPKTSYTNDVKYDIYIKPDLDSLILDLEVAEWPLQHIFFSKNMPGLDDDYRCFMEEQHGLNYFWSAEIDCKCSKIARLAHYLSFMWAFYYREVRYSKKTFKYYLKLEKLALSNYKYIKYFNPDWIFKPNLIMGADFQLVRELSDHLKAIKYQGPAFEQCGAYQSGSATERECWDELIDLYKPLSEKYTPMELHNCMKPIEQGWFDIKHEHNVRIEDADIGKLQSAVTSVQQSFFEGLERTVMATAKQIAVMFAAISTVALLSRVAAGIALTTVTGLLNFLYQFVFGGDESQIIENTIAIQQSGEVSVPFLPAMILKYMISPPEHMMKKIWQSSETDRIMRRIGYLGDLKIEKGIERLISWMETMVKRVQRWYSVSYLGLPDVPDLDSNSHEIIKWNEDVDKILKDYYAGDILYNDATFSTMWNVYSTGIRLGRTEAYRGWHRRIWSTVRKLGNLLETFKTHRRSGTSIRNPPVVIYLSGGTGCGKSTLTYPFGAELLKNIFEKENPSYDLKNNWQNQLYMRAPEQVYWDGYQNQLITIFDDFSQMADSQAQPNLELFEIIRSANNFPYPLHMADIADKSNTVFTSKVIIASSNLEKPDAKSLNFPTALYRRFDICVRVSWKKEYQNWTPPDNKFHPEIYSFEQYNMLTGESMGRLTYQDLIKLATNKYFKRSTFVDSVHTYIEGLFTDSSNEEQQEIAVEQGPVSPIGSLIEMLPGVQRTVAPVSRVQTVSALDIASRKVADVCQAAVDYIDPECLWASLQLNVAALKEHYDELRLSWVRFRETHPYLWTCVTAISYISLGLAFLKIFSKIRKLATKNTTSAIAESYSPPNVKVARQEAYTVVQPKLARAEAMFGTEQKLVEEQGVKDLNATEVLGSVMRYNVYKMYISETNVCIGHILFLKGKVALMPRHYLNHLKLLIQQDKNAHVYCVSPILRRAFECGVSDILENIRTYESPEEVDRPVCSRDLMAVEIPAAIVHKNIQELFMRKEDVSYVTTSSVMLPVIVTNNVRDSDTPVIMIRYAEGHSQVQRRECLNVANNDNVVVRYIRNAWEYNMDTVSSECGAPLIVRNTQVKRGKICGIHIAGIPGTGKGFSTPIYYEDIGMILKDFPEAFEQKVRLPLGDFPVEQCQVPSDCEFVRLGSISKPLAQPRKSKIVPSLAHASYKEPETKPCALQRTIVNGKEFDPRTYRIGRLGNVPVPLERRMIRNAKQAFEDEISQEISKVVDVVPETVKKVYTFDEAVLGIDGDPYVNCIKRTTSPGFPFVQQPGYKTRKEIFGNDIQCDLTTPQAVELHKRVDEIIINAKKGIVLDHYFMDTLKDERKPIHKAHKTRLFSAGPLDYLIASKMYFNGPVALLQRARNDCHISVGTNPYSEDWDRIVRKLQSKSENMVAGDFEGFDASQHQLLLEAAGEVLITLSERFLGADEDDVRVMRVLMISLINSMHITANEVYQWTHSLPSGHYLTAIINSIFVNISFACIWQINSSNISYLSARSFWKKCGIVAYGDDHIVSIPGKELETFNQMTLPALFAKIGLSYTMEEKETVATMRSRQIEDISYLRRGFLFDKDLNRWIAPLAIGTILEMPQWIHVTPDPKGQTIANLEFALKELSCHEPRVWNFWSMALQNECKKLGHYTEFTNQRETRAVCLDQDLVL